jgi:hypothetical protein
MRQPPLSDKLQSTRRVSGIKLFVPVACIALDRGTGAGQLGQPPSTKRRRDRHFVARISSRAKSAPASTFM